LPINQTPQQAQKLSSLFVVIFPKHLAGRRIHKMDASAYYAGDCLIGVLTVPRHFLGRPALDAEPVIGHDK